ncbi:MAG: undecaprenyldiphospho-muramoylpentapeptide beta-N-acetylglucosaminyltransferase [Bacteroidetes bacterium]|uniref:UDP-N-acetylglucosamine--N-acetylmuramyl-(pentapeptide) pyrophosphoryl-undecaprenol N-acetylglucosamine transferase n=1 Tax=Candidatus Cryptobacteroides excrementavium TaxID=2840759 RepID=A0A9D9J4A9_9BACT|nr:undecaprenyldiphospho-muramoylpentapeptide beta-N-acetylglucosaminyltransferase [Candidatus Cryptobacteroides excrementavium]
MDKRQPIRAIISGGGTGGHIFPALSIAGRLMDACRESSILFVGAEGKMEMEKVPAAGYEIKGLPVAGLQRRLSLSNLGLPFKILKSVSMAGKIIDSFRPDIAIGVGGYASAPLLWSAARKGIPTLIQEQNGYAGLTNRILGKKADRICVAYEGMERFFPAEKIVMTGNPIRSEIRPADGKMKEEAIRFYGLDPATRHIFIVGGSLGSGTLNKSMMKWITEGCPGGEDMEVIWQCGKYYKAETDRFMEEASARDSGIGKKIRHFDFISRMDLAYAAADIVISRSGAGAVSELCAAHKAAIFVPSPNVAEDHQTHNAMALVKKDAAMLITDAEAPEKLLAQACALARDPERIIMMERNIAPLARPEAAEAIVNEIYGILGKND